VRDRNQSIVGNAQGKEEEEEEGLIMSIFVPVGGVVYPSSGFFCSCFLSYFGAVRFVY
jgi:hypothetical protein